MSRVYLLLLLFTLGSCDFFKKNFDVGESESPKSDNKVTYHENGNMRSKCQADEEGKRHGTCYNYYENGNVKTTIVYNHGEKTKAISHYKTGMRALEINYKDGKKNGMRTRFYEDESIASQFEYKDDEAGKGLKEFDKDGDLVTKYPKLKLRTIDRIETHGEYLIEVYFSQNPQRGTYYQGALDDGKFKPKYGLIKLPKNEKRGVYRIALPPGDFIMEKMTFIGEYKTPYGNPYIVEKTLNVAVDNPF